MTPLAAFLAWLPVAYVLHVVLHEGAHAMTGMALGYRVSEFRLLPSIRDGRWQFGRVTFGAALASRDAVCVLAAPPAVEAAWCLGAGAGFGIASGWLAGVVAAECLAALVDLSTWCLTAWTRSGDAYALEVAAGLPAYSARFFSVLPPLAAVGAVLLSGMWR